MKYLLLFLTIITSFHIFNQTGKGISLNDKLEKLEFSSGIEKVELLINISIDYQNSSFKISQKYARKALELSRGLNNQRLIIKSYWALGGIKHLIGEVDSAFYYQSEALNLSIEIDDKVLIAKSQLNSAVQYSYKEDYEKAVAYYRKSFANLKSINDTSGLSLAYNNCANIYLSLGYPDSSVYYLMQSIKLKEIKNDKYGIGVSKINLGDIYFATNRFNLAKQEYLIALNIFENISNEYGIAYASIQLAKLEIVNENIESAEVYLQKSIELAEEIGSLPLLSKAYLEFGKSFEQAGDFEKALKYSLKLHTINDSLAQSKYSTLMKDMESIQAFTEQKLRMEILENDLENRERKITYLSVILGITGVLFFIVILFYFLIKRKDKILFRQSIKNALLHKENVVEDDLMMEDLHRNMMDLLEGKKIFLDPNLSLSRLSELLSSNSNYVSKCINQKFDDNFNTVINMYRVNEAKSLILIGETDTYTLATIAEKCGFSSLSVFNRAFKKETGITPSYFAKNLP